MTLGTPPLLDPVVLTHLGAFAVAALACFAGLRRVFHVEDPDTRRGLAGLLVTSGIWALAQALFLVAPGELLKQGFYIVGLLAGFAAVGAWLYFCSAYTGRTLHRVTTYRRLAVAVYLSLSALKMTNPVHGFYFLVDPTATPFPHLAVQHQPIHWLAVGLAYALSAVGYFMLFELFTQTSQDTRPLVALVGLTALPLALNLVGTATPWLVDMSYEPLGVAAFAVGVLFVFFDRFRLVTLAGGVDDPVVFLDDDGRIRDSNPEARSVFPELVGATGEPLSETLPAVAARLDEDEVVIGVERDGETTYYMLSTNDFTSGSSRVGRMVLLADVTDTERYRREIERQNERLDRFASIVSHDLRNPLNVAQGHLELERERRDSDYLAAADGALDRMEALIEDVLTLARQGEDIDEREPTSLAAVAEDAWETVDSADADLAVEVDATVVADPDRLRQLLENLYRNAIEHGGESVTVTVGSTEGGFYVADDGPGIPEEERPDVFEPGHTSREDGTGFGLAIVEAITSAHGWNVEVTESGSGGARFEFTGVEFAD